MSPLAPACPGRHMVSTPGSSNAAAEIRSTLIIPLILEALILTSVASSLTRLFERTFLHIASTSGGQNPLFGRALQAIRNAKAEPAVDVVSCRKNCQRRLLAN